MPTIKILMVTVTLGEGSGVNSFIMNYFRKMDHEKVQIDVLVNFYDPEKKSPYEDEIRQAGGNVFLIPSVNQPIRHIRALNKILQEGHYDIIHNNTMLITLPLMFLSRLKGVPIRILHSHSIKFGATRWKIFRNSLFFPLLLHNCNRYVACSDAAGRAKFGSRPYTVLPNVVDAQNFLFSAKDRMLRREQEGVGNKTVIITVGRAHEEKNPFFALETIRKLSEWNKDVVYWWVGDGALLSQMKRKAEQLGIQDIVVFWGRQSNMAAFYAAADILFMPSLYEGMPLTGIEAQAMGLPSIVSDTVTQEMVYTDLVSFVSLHEPIETWVDAIEKQIARIPQRRSYAEELRNSVFSAENAGKNLEKLYEDLLAGGK